MSVFIPYTIKPGKPEVWLDKRGEGVDEASCDAFSFLDLRLHARSAGVKFEHSYRNMAPNWELRLVPEFD